MVLEERLSAFEADLIYRLIGPDGPNVIVYEIAHMRGGPATRSALGMETVLRLAAYKSGIHLHGLHSATLKKFTTGDGKADKSLMIKHARLITENYVIEDDNEADAICLANWGEENGVETEWGAVEFAKRVSTKKKKKPNTTAKQKE